MPIKSKRDIICQEYKISKQQFYYLHKKHENKSKTFSESLSLIDKKGMNYMMIPE